MSAVPNPRAAQPGTPLSALRHLTPSSKSPGQARVPLPRLYQRLRTPEGISAIQSALASRGYYEGSPTGQWDQKTIAALQAFQSANGIKPTGRPDPFTLQKLDLVYESTVPKLKP